MLEYACMPQLQLHCMQRAGRTQSSWPMHQMLPSCTNRFPPAAPCCLALQGATIVNQGDVVDKLYVCKIGEVQLFKDGEPATDTSFMKVSATF